MAALTKRAWVHEVNKLTNYTEKPENFLSSQPVLAENCRKLAKILYDSTKHNETNKSRSALPELIIQNFDDEQVWQQIELQNNERNNDLISKISKVIAVKEKLRSCFSELAPEEAESDQESEDETSVDQHEVGEKVRKKLGSKKTKAVRSKVQPTEVDDKFFKLREMERYLEQEEMNLDKGVGDEEFIDYFADDPSSDDDEAEDPDDDEGESFGFHYQDFFDPVDGESPQDDDGLESDKDDDLEAMSDGSDSENELDPEENQDDENVDIREPFGKEDQNDSSNESDDSNEEEDSNKDNTKSTFESRQERLQQRIEMIHEEALGEKPWQLTGEVTAVNRPQNALLEEVLEFEMTTRPAPIITEKTTIKLEDIIRQRIKNKAWDDVERKIKPVDEPTEYKKKLVLDQEKSKLSLAEVYEQDFLKQQQAATAAKDPFSVEEEREQEEPPEHIEIKQLMHSLFSKLDALSNYHFTPKQPAPEVKIVSNLPAVTVEEVAPVAASDATLLAPEEVKEKTRGILTSTGERSKTDKKRERRKKKKKQHIRRMADEKKETESFKQTSEDDPKFRKRWSAKQIDKAAKQGKITKLDENKGKKAVKSSTAFFTQLQEEVSSHIKDKTNSMKRKKTSGNNVSIKKLKL